MADAVNDDNDDNWLYGEGTAESTENAEENTETGDKSTEQTEPEKESAPDDATPADENDATNDDSHFNDEHFAEDSRENENGDADSQENGDSDSDDSDDVKVVIGEIKAGTQAYPSLNIKRSGLVVQSGADKQKTTGKFTVEEFDSVGTINGVPAQEFNVDVIEDKPWRKPGADISDYFNYGFTEDTWRAYCERQRRIRVADSGAGLAALGAPPLGRTPDQPKYGPTPVRRIGPPPGTVMVGRPGDGGDITGTNIPVRESAIQVMTADRREYSRNKFPDMSMPPPGGDFFPGDPPPFYGAGAPPYADEHWGGGDSGWAPSDIKELTPGPGPMAPPPNLGPPAMGPPPGMVPPPMMQHGPGMGPMPPMMGPQGPYGPPMGHHGPVGPPGHIMSGPVHDRDGRERMRDRDEHRDRRERDRRDEERDEREMIDRDRDRERDRDRDRERERERDRERASSRSVKPDRHREKSHRRERSRSRSRRHKSRSRSPVARHREPSRAKSKKTSGTRKEKEEED